MRSSILLFFFIVGCTRETVDYSLFLEAEVNFEKADSLQKQGQYLNAIQFFQAADRSIDNFSAPYHIAECIMHLGDERVALEMARISVTRGFPLDRFDQPLFRPIFQQIAESFSEDSLKYASNLDTALRGRLDRMISRDQEVRNLGGYTSDDMQAIDKANIDELKAICEKYGWPGRKFLGYGRIPEPSTVVLHATEADNLNFLGLAMRASLDNKASWYETRAIMINLLWRFNRNSCTAFRFLEIKSNDTVDMNASFFELSSLGYFLMTNRNLSIELIDQRNKDILESSVLSEIKDFIVSQGANDSQVSIKNEPAGSCLINTLGFLLVSIP